MKSSIDSILSISRLCTTPDYLDVGLRSILCETRHACNAEISVVSFYDAVTNELYYKRLCSKGNRQMDLEGEIFNRSPIQTGVLGRCVQTRNRVHVGLEKTPDEERMVREEQLGIHIESIMAAPLIAHEKILGVIAVVNKCNGERFSTYEQKLLQVISSMLALHIENNRLHEEVLNRTHLTHLGENIANSAHGLKNILNNLDGGTFIVESGVMKKKMDTVTEGWEIMKRNSHRLREIVLDMLLFARPGKLVYKSTDINKLCQDLYELVYENALRENVQIQTELDPNIGMCCVDDKGIYRCILNLVSNAVSACHKKTDSWVLLKTELVDENVIQISVSDNGTGMSEETLDHIFEIFFTTKGSKGTGLGLPVTKKIVEEHKGTIEVESRTGEGSTFMIKLPKIHAKYCS